MTRKGILLAGGSGTRLWPITMGVSKQLLPIYDKPMIYYPLSVLMLAGIREIAVITTPEDQSQFVRLMGDGSQWGLSFTWIVQPSPDGLAQAYLLAKDFLAGAPSAMILGDNIFFGHGLPELLASADARESGGTVFGYRVADPERYGVAEFDDEGKVRSLVEKPQVPLSHYAVTGLYFLDAQRTRVCRVPPALKAWGTRDHRPPGDLPRRERPARGEDGPGLRLAGHRHPRQPARCRQLRPHPHRAPGPPGRVPDEIAYAAGWIDNDQLAERAHLFHKSDYGRYLKSLLR
jgi:glucose-1-phosphate thymidylyltransferase